MQKEQLTELMGGISSKKEPSFSETAFLKMLQDKKISVDAYLINGIKLQGTIITQDDRSICLYAGEYSHQKLQLVYKHALSTIVPHQSAIVKMSL